MEKYIKQWEVYKIAKELLAIQDENWTFDELEQLVLIIRGMDCIDDFWIAKEKYDEYTTYLYTECHILPEPDFLWWCEWKWFY